MSRIVSDNGKKYRSRRGWYLAVLGLVAAAAVYVTLRSAAAPSYDASTIPGCVSPRQSAIEGDISPSRMRYQSFGRVETDDKDKHEQFLARVISKIDVSQNGIAADSMYVTFSVFYRFNKDVYKQFASAAICRQPFGSSENQCRNRNYYFFSHIDPNTLANVLLDDISKYTPIIRRCVWDK